jgi:hypothetical protein
MHVNARAWVRTVPWRSRWGEPNSNCQPALSCSDGAKPDHNMDVGNYCAQALCLCSTGMHRSFGVLTPTSSRCVIASVFHSLMRFCRLMEPDVVCKATLHAEDLSGVSSAIVVLPAKANVQFFYLC